MGFELRGETGATADLGVAGWTFYLDLARAYRWIPMGTLPPVGLFEADWPGAYESNDGPLVCREDASAWSAALERALNDPDRARVEGEVCQEMNRRLRELAWRIHRMQLGPEEDEDIHAVAGR